MQPLTFLKNLLLSFFALTLCLSHQLTANKMQNLLTTQQPEGTHNTDLHELQKNISLTTI